MNISRITVGRLFNLGNYEHIRYELTVDVKEGESASSAITAIESILEGMKPLRTCCIETESEIAHAKKRLEAMRTMPAVQWEREFGGGEGTPSEIIQRCEQDLNEKIQKRTAAMETAKTARRLFDDLGGASQWKDAKLDWQEYDEDF